MSTTAPYQLFRPLPASIEDALRASIARFGVLVPVVKDQHGHVIDGHHRARLADELGIKYRVDEVAVADVAEARELARTLNADRRQLTEVQRREVVALLAAETVAAGPEGREDVARHSPNAIAGALGVSLDTVQRDMAELTDAGRLSRPAKTLGLDGKARPTRQAPVPVSKRSRRALPLLAKDAGWALRRDVEKLERVFADDRLNQYKDKVAGHLHGHLTYAVETLRGLLDRLDQPKEV